MIKRYDTSKAAWTDAANSSSGSNYKFIEEITAASVTYRTVDELLALMSGYSALVAISFVSNSSYQTPLLTPGLLALFSAEGVSRSTTITHQFFGGSSAPRIVVSASGTIAVGTNPQSGNVFLYAVN